MKYENLTLDEERALYGIQNAEIESCTFAGPADGESALKECRDIQVKNCSFLLRYPFWHVRRANVDNCNMTETCRAALWYDQDIAVRDCTLCGIKAVRECENIRLQSCVIDSTEFGWFCRNLHMTDCELKTEYPFLKSADLEIENLAMQGKYSFQYVENVTIRNSVLDTKDAFWHSKNVTVYDSIVKGEYLAWYSENLRLVRCKIIGTQPLCCAKGLVLEDCEMEDTDLSFEYSDVQATVCGKIDSVKNPRSGYIEADAIGEIILDKHQYTDSNCDIVVRHLEKSAM